MLRARPLAVACTAAVALALGAAPSALAGTYTVNPDTTTDVSGWSFNPDTGVNGCSLLSLPGPCAATDVARPTPLRILMSGAVATDAYGAWRWDAPEGVSIVSGSVKLSYKTTADTSVYMKAILRSEVFHTQPKVHTVTTDGSATWTVPSGKEVFALFLDNAAAHTYADKWQNSLAISSMSLTLRDDTAPAVSLSGPLASGAWQSSAQPVCLTAHATDAGSGVASVELLDEFGQQVDRVVAPVGDALHPGSTDLTRDLCLTPSDYGDGDHSMTVIAHDAAGEVTYQPLTVEIDHTAPAAAQMTPAERTTDRRAPVSFTVDAGPSGLAAFSAWLDGAPMTIDGATAQLTPATNLAYGLHSVSWHAADRAGNVRDASWTFRVADEVPPALSDAAPAAGSSGEERRPAIGFTLTDAGIGVDPTSVRVLLDGVDVAPLGMFTGDRFAVVPAADLGFGIHQLRVLASDRSGNAMAPAVWSFSVIDVTAPTLGDPRPDDGSSGSDRTPPISIAAADTGVGIDPAGISLTLDGQEIAGSATWSGGRLTYQPAAALAFGQHTVVARATDRAGNSSAPVTWRFTVRDEVPPAVSGRLPAAGSTVAGAVPIGFDVADAGTGVDPASLQVLVDGSDVTSWGSFDGSRFRYAPGDLGAGVHTVSVTVADRAGNVAGPLMWQFAVANPATLRLSVAGAPRSLVFGGHGTAVLSATSDGSPLAGTHVLVSTRVAGAAGFGAARTWVADAAGEVRLPVAPAHTTDYHVELADHPAVQADFTVAVVRRVSLAAASGQVRHGFPLRLSGTVAPLAPGARVTVQLLTGRGWVAVAHPLLGGRSGFTATLVPRVRGRYLFRVLAPATATNLGGTSRTVVVVAR